VGEQISLASFRTHGLNRGQIALREFQQWIGCRLFLQIGLQVSIGKVQQMKGLPHLSVHEQTLTLPHFLTLQHQPRASVALPDGPRR
jgi:hypothetical protein